MKNFYAFACGLSEAEGEFVDAITEKLLNDDYYSTYELSIEFDNAEDDKEAFLSNFASQLTSNKNAEDIYNAIVPLMKSIKDFEKEHPLTYQARFILYSELWNKVDDFSNFRVEID